MIRPDDEEKPFVARWNSLIRVLLVESSVKAVARTAMDYANFYDGTSCRPTNERLARETGYDERTVRAAWALMRAAGLAERVGHAVPHKDLADVYELQIPSHWDSLAILGPRSRKFTCLYCGKLLNPPPVGYVDADGATRWRLWKAAFCKPPRKSKGRDAIDCYAMWNRRQQVNGEPVWHDLGNTAQWKLFREARGDDW